MTKSQCLPVARGVLQGSVLGPMSFTFLQFIYCNYLRLRNRVHLYQKDEQKMNPSFIEV